MTKQIRLKDGKIKKMSGCCGTCSFGTDDGLSMFFSGKFKRCGVNGFVSGVDCYPAVCPLEEYVEEPVKEQMMICENAANCKVSICDVGAPHPQHAQCCTPCDFDGGIKGSRCVPYKPEKPTSKSALDEAYSIINGGFVAKIPEHEPDKEAQKILNTIFEMNCVDLDKRLTALEQHRIPSLEELVFRKYHECRKD